MSRLGVCFVGAGGAVAHEGPMPAGGSELLGEVLDGLLFLENRSHFVGKAQQLFQLVSDLVLGATSQ